METVLVTVETGYSGILTNVVQVTTVEGATGVYTETCTSAGDYYLLALGAQEPLINMTMSHLPGFGD